MQKVHPAVSVNNVFPLIAGKPVVKPMAVSLFFFQNSAKDGLLVCQSRTPLRCFQISDKGSLPFKNTRSRLKPTSIFIAYDGHKMSLAFVGWDGKGGSCSGKGCMISICSLL